MTILTYSNFELFLLCMGFSMQNNTKTFKWNSNCMIKKDKNILGSFTRGVFRNGDVPGPNFIFHLYLASGKITQGSALQTHE